jgi:hypothetical protein
MDLVTDTERTAPDLNSEAIDLLADKYRQHPQAVKPGERQGPLP